MNKFKDLSIKQLVAKYNEYATKLGLPLLVHFRNKEYAVKRVNLIIKQFDETSSKSFLGLLKGYNCKPKIKPIVKTTSPRFKLYLELLKGMTRENIAEFYENSKNWEKRAAKTIRRLHTKHGFGVKIVDDKIYVFTGVENAS